MDKQLVVDALQTAFMCILAFKLFFKEMTVEEYEEKEQ